jgi:hypothetical protein
MKMYDELQKQGYEFQHEHGDSEKRTELWVNPLTCEAVRIEWFSLVEEVE